jgi:hypothetical protein
MRGLAAVLLAVAMLFVSSNAAFAEDEEKPEISATVTDTEVDDNDEDPEPDPIPCGWFYPPSSEEEAEVYNVVTEIVTTLAGIFFRSTTITVTYFYDDGVLNRWNDPAGRFEWRQVADCTGATHPNGVSTGDVRYTPTEPPDPSILLRRTTVTVTEEIDVPPPRISPSESAAINLGLWLGVEPVEPVVARAQLGPLWAETTATLESTTFDLGDGTTITCPGNGTPIPEHLIDSVEQGPCGHTYSDVDDLDVSEITVTATWAITWELSDGRTGSQSPDIVLSTSLPYEVYEIQTVGVGD